MAIILRPQDRKLEPLDPAAGPDSLHMQYLRPDEPYVHMTRVPPGYKIALHSHSETEVTVILSGSAHVGDAVCEAGSVLIIDADEEYSLVAGGHEPLTFLVVRPRRARYKPA
jgi:hypothetical protein